MIVQVSHSRIETFKQCGYKYRLKYIDELKTYPNYDADNPLIVGTALHTGIEKDVKTAVEWYYSQFPIITDAHVEEAIKLEYIVPMCKSILPDGEYEKQIKFNDFIGFIDLLVKVDDNTYDIYDFKYSNNVKRYLESGQLHEYKWFFEKMTGFKVRNTYFLFAPKVGIRKKKTESQEEFRIRLRRELEGKEPQLVKVDYDQSKVDGFFSECERCRNATEFIRNQTRLCDWCEYQDYCEKGDTLDIMNLPKNERRTKETDGLKKIWLYGLPFSGKTYLANRFPNVLMLNTDGNFKYVDAPYVHIKDEVEVEGRKTVRTFAWQIFKDTILELEKHDNSFETIVVDLLEDTYEHCRLWCYDHLNIEHESDNSFKAWDFVRNEFLTQIKRLTNLDYNIVLISHEDDSKDVTRKSGDKITSIQPNISGKVALKVAGMVDIVGRVINDEGKRTISFKTNEVVFGGGRLDIKSPDIPCEYDALMQVYENAPKPEAIRPVQEEPKPEEPKQVEPVEEKKVDESVPAATSTRKVRRVRNTEGA